MAASAAFRAEDGTLLGALVAAAAIDAAIVFLVPGLLGYPSGGIFLLDALPIFAAAFGVAAILAIPALALARDRVGVLASIAFVLGLAAIGAANAYLWVLCVASV